MPKIDPLKDDYATLGVPLDASQDDIRRAYRELARLTHPDSGSGDVELFQSVRDAYAILSSFESRDAYDKLLQTRGRGTAPLAIDALQSRIEIPGMEEEQALYVILDLVPRPDLGDARRKLNLAIVIDRSTSMREDRMQSVKAAAMDVIDALTPADRLAVVAFSDRAEVIIASELVENKTQFRSALMSIVPGGGTELYQGLSTAISQVRAHVAEDTISHVLLLTDGRTYGDEKLALAAAARVWADGIGISTFGIGEDWNDVFLDDLARQGGGTSHYIDTPGKVRDALRNQVKNLGALVLHEASAQISTAQGVRLMESYRAAPYMEILQPDAAGGLALGGLSAGVTVVLALKFAIALTGTGPHRIARVTVEGDDMVKGAPAALWHDVWVTLRDYPAVFAVPPRLFSIMSRLSVYSLQERAWRALEDGSKEQAAVDLESAATQLFDLGYHELGEAAMLEVDRISRGTPPSSKGRKQLRYGTRVLGDTPSGDTPS